MKPTTSFSISVLVTILVLVFIETTDAGTRYKDIVFASAKATTNISFGSSVRIDGSTAPLLLDLYEPENDTLKSRPLVIFIHGGSLVVGERQELGSYCTDFAKRGYVAATIDYRIGIESPKGVRTILEALLRGVQDTKAAVRFFRAKAAEYGIDTSRIYLEGSSAGSMIAVHYAYWDQDEIPADVNQAKWGTIEGTSGNPGFSTAIAGVINYCGAIVDPAWIDAGEAPVGNFHGLLDAVVPADSGVSTDFGITLHGGVAISRAALQLGIYQQGAFFPLMGHGGNTDSLRLFSSNFLYSLMVLSSSTPQDLSSMELSATSLKVFLYDTYTFLATALDRSGNRIVLPQSMVQYSCDTRIGTIASTGIFTPSDHPDSGYVYVKFNGTITPCYLKTYDFKYFIVRPKLAVTDTLRSVTFSVDTYDADAVQHLLPITKFTLVSTDPSVGTISTTGTFSGKRSGTTKVIATFKGYSDTSVVRVEGARGWVGLDQLESVSGWTFEGVNLDSLSVTASTEQKSAGSASLKIDYKFTYDVSKTSYMVYLNRDILIYGIPDSMYLDVKSDGRRHRLYYRLSDADSQFFRASGGKYLNNSQVFDFINASMTTLSPLSGTSVAVPPLTLRRLEIQLAGETVQGQSTSGTIYIDNLRLKYPGTATDVRENVPAPLRFSLEQNYPNPFNPSTTIQYNLSSRSYVVLAVYNLLGQRIVELVNGEKGAGHHEIRFDAGDLASGVYLYRLEARPSSGVQAAGFRETRKLIVVK